MSYVASRLPVVKPSASMAASMAVKALRATGVDVIDLGLGEPDFPTPPHVAEAALAAARPIVVANGAKQVIFNALMAMLNDDEVILPAPYFVSYPDDTAVVKYLLNEGHVSAVPGAAYGLSPFFRISTATSDAILADAIARIARAVAALEPGEAK